MKCMEPSPGPLCLTATSHEASALSGITMIQMISAEPNSDKLRLFIALDGCSAAHAHTRAHDQYWGKSHFDNSGSA